LPHGEKLKQIATVEGDASSRQGRFARATLTLSKGALTTGKRKAPEITLP
jgi:hypothetical protein